MIQFHIHPDRPVHAVSPDLFGIFFEDINFSADGGLNANMVNNYSFDGIYMQKNKAPAPDYLRYWHFLGCTAESCHEMPVHENSRYARVRCSGTGRIENLGYNGGKAYGNCCAVSIKSGHHYCFEAYLRGSVPVRICVEDDHGEALTDEAVLQPHESWEKLSCRLSARAEGYGKLVIEVEGSGVLDIDCVQLYDEDYWGKGDPKWRHGKLRRDLVEALLALHPQFMRFPGGCIVEGVRRGNEYNWKETVGELPARKSKFSLWSEQMPDGGVNQSYQIGFYEYFCLCEDLGAKPQPTLFAGLNCQVRGVQRLKTDSREFREYVVQNYLDLIDFANGDPETNRWAKLRADMGHPAPFGLERIGIGNENFGADYVKKFDAIRQAIHKKDPNIVCILCAGFTPFRLMTRRYWSYAKAQQQAILVDEHCYHAPGWFFRAAQRFDKYPREVGHAKLYFGEYAANGLFTGRKVTAEEANDFWSALSEAAFLTGVERNSDFVAATSYAPLFNHVGGTHWTHNLIDFDPAHVCLTPNYMVQMLFGQAQGRETVSYTAELPDKLWCSVMIDDNRLIIKLVNANTQDFTFDFGLSEGTVKTIRSDDLHARNILDYGKEPEYAVSIQETMADLRHFVCRSNSVNVITVAR